jgi:exopolysaccharide production protein ExoQ
MITPMHIRKHPNRAASAGASVKARQQVGDRVFLFFVCSMWTGLNIPIQQLLFLNLDAGNELNTVLNLILVIASFYLFFANLYARRVGFSKYYVIICIYILLVGSSLWSISPVLSGQRSLTFGASLIIGIYLIEKLHIYQIMAMLLAQLTSIAIFSFITRILWKSYSVFPGTHDLSGIYGNKNTFGMVMSVALLCSLYLSLSHRRIRYHRIGESLFLFGCVILSFSTTAIIQALITITIFMVYRVSKSGNVGRVIAGGVSAALLIVGVIIAGAPDAVLGIFGKDSTLTGRSYLWAYVWEVIDARPWLGWGFQSFWEASNPIVVSIWRQIGWVAPEAHNGILDILVDVGYVGVAVFAFTFCLSLRVAIVNLIWGDRSSGILSLATVASMALFTISENSFLNPDIRSIIYYIAFINGIYAYNRTARRGKSEWTGNNRVPKSGRVIAVRPDGAPKS